MRIASEKRQMVFLVLLTSGIIASIYWRVIFLPFVSDDWWYLRQLQTLGITESLKYSFDPTNKIVYVPLGEAVMVLMYEFFGADPASIRLLNLLIHAASSSLVVIIMGHVLENKWVGFLSGVVYASAIAVHLDIFAWVWATYGDIGATFFFFLSIWLYLKEKIWPSAFAYLLGCLFKPTIIFLPALLLLHSLILPGEKKLDLHPGRLFIKWLPFLAFGGLLTGLKLLGGIPTAYHEDHPYFMDFWGRHLVTNAQRYLNWMFQSVFPITLPGSTMYKVMAGISMSAVLMGAFTALLAITRDKAFRRMFFLTVWLVAGLLTVIFLPNHTYRYYSVYSLPAFAALFFYSVHYLLSGLKADYKVILASLSFIGLFAAVGSIYQSIRIFDERLHQNTFADGTNMLIRRAATVEIVTERLQKDFPTLPPGFVIVLENTDLGAFGAYQSAFQYIYDTDAFDVIDSSDMIYDNGEWYFRTPASAPQYLHPDLVVVYELTGDEIVRKNLNDLPRNSLSQ